MFDRLLASSKYEPCPWGPIGSGRPCHKKAALAQESTAETQTSCREESAGDNNADNGVRLGTSYTSEESGSKAPEHAAGSERVGDGDGDGDDGDEFAGSVVSLASSDSGVPLNGPRSELFLDYEAAEAAEEPACDGGVALA